MPTPLKTTENIRKHMSKEERQARQAEEGRLRSGKRPTLKAPTWLGDDARKIFETMKRKMREYEVLESSDAELLALYCDAQVRYQSAIKELTSDDVKVAAIAQAWSRLALSYSEKLGISPTGRARLAKKKAERPQADSMDQLLDEVVEYVNGDIR